MRRTIIGVGCLSLLLAANASADVWIDYTGPGYSETDISINVLGTPRSGIYVGRYDFTVSATPSSPIKTAFSSFCLSPMGTLQDPQWYKPLEFLTADDSRNPNGWAENATGTEQYGIQNAAWLWNHYGAAVSSDAEGAGLALAIWESLFDSTDFGAVTIDNTAGKFKWSETSLSATSKALTYLGYLNAAEVEKELRTGYLYRSTDGHGNFVNPGQDLILTGPVVPEPTTVIAGALLLLPFGVSTLRMLRKRA